MINQFISSFGYAAIDITITIKNKKISGNGWFNVA